MYDNPSQLHYYYWRYVAVANNALDSKNLCDHLGIIYFIFGNHEYVHLVFEA